MFLGALILLAANVSIQARPRIAELPGPLHYTVPDLIALLKSPYVLKRRYGARLLGLKGRPAGVAIPHLKLLEKDPDKTVRWSAYDSLVQLWPHADGKLRAQLLRDLNSSNPATQRSAIRLLRDSRSANRTHYAALRAFAEKGDPYWRDDAVKAMAAGAQTADELRPVLDFLHAKSHDVRAAAALGILTARREAYRSLLPEFKRLVRADAASRRTLLGAILRNRTHEHRDGDFTAIILAALKGSDPGAQSLALKILTGMPDVAAARLTEIKTLYASKSSAVRENVPAYLPLRGEGPSLITALNDDHASVVDDALTKILHRRKEPRAILIDVLKNRHKNPAWRAENKLHRILTRSEISRENASKLVTVAKSGNCRALRLLRVVATRDKANHHGPALAKLLPSLRTFVKKDTCGRDSIRLLSHVGTQGTSLLREHITRTNRLSPSVQAAFKFSDPAAMPFLFELTAHASEAISLPAAKLALRAGARVDPVHLVPMLPRITALLSHGNPRMRLIGVRILSGLDHPTPNRVRVMEQLLTKSRGDIPLRKQVLIAAAEMGARGTVFASRIFEGLVEPKTRKAAKEALERMGPAAHPVLKNLIACARNEKDAALRLTCMSLLPIIDPLRKRILPVLGETALGKGPPEIRREAVQGLRLFRLESTLAVHEQLLKDADPEIVKLAVYNLGTTGPAAISTVPAISRALMRTTNRKVWNDGLWALGRIHEDRSPSRRVRSLHVSLFLYSAYLSTGASGGVVTRRGSNQVVSLRTKALSSICIHRPAGFRTRWSRYRGLLAHLDDQPRQPALGPGVGRAGS